MRKLLLLKKKNYSKIKVCIISQVRYIFISRSNGLQNDFQRDIDYINLLN